MTGDETLRLIDRVTTAEPLPSAGRTLADVLLTWADATPDRTALIDDHGAVSWRELHARTSALVAGLRARGLSVGDAVAVASPPTVDLVALYLATAATGTVLVPVNLRLPPSEVASALRIARPTLVLSTADQHHLVAAVEAEVIADHEDHGWADQLATDDSDGQTTEVDPSTPHLLLFTSGTTGRPKAALIDQRRSIGDASAAALASGLRAEDRLLGYQPLYHTGGWDFMKQLLLVGGSVVLMPRFDADRALELIELHRCTSLFAVPLVLHALLESSRFARADLSSLRHLMFASYEPSDLVPRAVEGFRTRGARHVTLEHVYGQTEAGSFISTLRPEQATPQNLDSVGTPVPGVTVALLDPDLRAVADGDTGEVCVRSETVMRGYVDDPAATNEAFRGGWLHTGDLGRRDEHGLLRLTGRLREMIRTAGENVFPKQVETELVAHPDVVDCAVFGVPDERWDEVVVAAVVRTPGSTVDAEALTRWLRERLAGFQVPRRIVLVNELPKTPAGKTARAQLPGLLDEGATR